jgi:hypothetical protein
MRLKKVMEEAIPMGTVNEVHFYGRNLLGTKEAKEAFKVFKMNYDKFPNVYPQILEWAGHILHSENIKRRSRTSRQPCPKRLMTAVKPGLRR